MGSGDLNLLKSWNPKLVKNREKVWVKEKELINEELKLKERQLELQKEKELDELVGAKTRALDWMYNDPLASSQTQNNDYLLGKKKLDASVVKKDSSTEELKKDPTTNLVSQRQKFDYSLDDPMSAINKAKRKQIKKKNGKKQPKVHKQ
ncbi:hypothetical protein TPHA_0B04150 [Tetrapisispora phaffii CBS 4417]|uniref:Pre-mRNA-splicing factor CWC25 n=1 Tax=Tetrapisispora phaffii (strain ATCC 24235 / CBS 4417 / NBRC 1672 / NRRL Y-8282 / UCD 70-5) TaxID=1071381 RepID=G8BQ04_TETPH|nr:hypothetical protein TPHA_0B04150 [Tetrapisispora phaffii CBS 4417]CCE62085.1 hypothetical protein TPHA_0B04150 [Tetrapisispora phaffii CBS 4417]